MIAVTNGRVLTITSGILENGTVLVEGGKIEQVGVGIPIPDEAEIIDAKGGYITPGLIDCHTHICNFCEPRMNPGPRMDGNEGSDPITPHIRAMDAINPWDWAIEPVKRAGFTTVYTQPGSGNVIGGMGIAMKLKGETAEEMAIPGTEAMKFALGENPKRFHGLEQNRMPWTRMGTAALLRETLFKAKNYSDRLRQAESNPDKAPEPDFKLDALVKVVRGEMRCRIHCHRADDIMTAIRIATEFGLDFTLEHATEGYKIKSVIAKYGIPCVVGPFPLAPMKQELWELKLEDAALLTEAGVKVCLTADTGSETAWLPVHAGLLTRRGMTEENILKGLTIYPAEVLNLDHRIGSLETGKDADIAIFDGDPLSNMTLCRLTMIDGEVVHNTL